MTRIYIGNTDNNWFDFCASLRIEDEVNFWQPSAKSFNAIAEGERFAFRLKSPRNKIGGFGTLSNSSMLPIQIAWDAFGVRNGVASLSDFIAKIARYRLNEKVTPATFIVCRVLVEPVFFPEFSWFDVPDWSNSIVSGKTFRGDERSGMQLWRDLEAAAGAQAMPSRKGVQEPSTPFERYGEPTLVKPRLGQGAFRVAVMEMYERQCALTDGRVLPALDAAHIRPYADGGLHVGSNGILLRKDIHSVFDAGYATIDQDYVFVVSDKVKEVFNNGSEYRRLHGTRLRLPHFPAHHPDKDALRWHNDHKFVG